MLFVIVSEAFHVLMNKAKHLGRIKGFSVDNVDQEVSHLQFADDTITFCDTSMTWVIIVKFILKWFEKLSGRQINYGKCEMIGVRMEDINVALLASAFGCKVGKLPSKYLGLPLCIGLPKKCLWDTFVERTQKKLSSWKGRYLSMGGRVVLIKSVLLSILIYFLSCFKCPKSVYRRIEKIQHDFLWNDSVENRKYHLVQWEEVCKPLAHGGLGIRSIEKVIKPCWVSG